MINADPIRWSLGMGQDAGGSYVSYHDYAILLAEAEQLRAALAKREEVADVIDKPARIGATIFRVGVQSRLVIERAQREYEYHEAGKMFFPAGVGVSDEQAENLRNVRDGIAILAASQQQAKKDDGT